MSVSYKGLHLRKITGFCFVYILARTALCLYCISLLFAFAFIVLI